mgnify:CR=1 FL=1
MKIQDKQVNLSFSLFSFLKNLAGLAIIVILAFFLFKERNKSQELEQLYKTAKQELEISINKEGQFVAKIEALETAKAKDFIDADFKDQEIVALQKEVKDMKRYLKKQGSVTKFKTTTENENTVRTREEDTRTSKDILVSDGNTFLRLPYQRSFGDIWHTLDFHISTDSTSYRMQTVNEYSLTIGLEKKGLLGLGKSIPFAEVTNQNPYTQTEALRTYQVSLPKPKNISIGPNISYSLGADLKLQPTIGIGIQYSLIRFKL